MNLLVGLGFASSPLFMHATDDDGDLALHAGRQQLVEGDLVEQRVPAGAQQDVEIGLAHEAGQHLGLVHPGADRADNTL